MSKQLKNSIDEQFVSNSPAVGAVAGNWPQNESGYIYSGMVTVGTSIQAMLAGEPLRK